MSCSVGYRHSSDVVLMWLWYKPVAIAAIQPLAWEPPYATGAALKRQKKKKELRNLEHRQTMNNNVGVTNKSSIQI